MAQPLSWRSVKRECSESGALSRSSVEVASRYIGVREVTTNRSPQIDAWERPFGLRGQSWCMMFQWNVEQDNGNRDGYKNPLLKTALCSQQVQYAKRIGVRLKIVPCGIGARPEVKPGWLGFTSSRGVRQELIGKLWSGHVFRVRSGSAIGADTFDTVEGNYKNMVTVVQRKKSKTLCFIKPI